MSAFDEACALVAELLPLADTLRIEDRRYLMAWQQRLSREGVMIHEAQLVWLKDLKAKIEGREIN